MFLPYRRSIIRATTPDRIASEPNTQISNTSVLMSGISANIATPELKFCKNRLRSGDEMETENEPRKKLASVETGLANLTEPLARRGAKARAGGGLFLHPAIPIGIPQFRPAAEHQRGGDREAVSDNEYENEQPHRADGKHWVALKMNAP